jgi:hypothetical protein
LKKPLAICAVLGLLGLGAAGTAAAQAVYVGPGYAGSGLSDPVLPPYEIMSIVRSTGLAPLTRPMRRGPYYVLVAVDRAGRQMRVVVDAHLGDIVNMRPAVAAATYGPEAGRPEVGRPSGLPGAAGVPLGPTAPYGAHPNGDALAPMPPRSNPTIANAASPNAAVPNPTTSNPHAFKAPGAASTRLAVAEPALPPAPPLPRPRPKLALNVAPAAAAAPAAEAPPPAIKPPVPATTPPSVAPGGADDTSKQIE